jgi:hypothetical protein
MPKGTYKILKKAKKNAKLILKKQNVMQLK